MIQKEILNGGYHPTDYSSPLGKITIRRAVESSQNIPFVEIMEKLGPNNSINYLKKLGISTLTNEDNSLVLSLGGLQKGISPLEMASAYATIANNGEYIEPTFYNKIDSKLGKEILKPKQEKRKVFSKEVAYILKEILTQPVIGANGTATYCKISGVDVAAKTGTTDENYDRWLCGFTPYYTAVTWYGYDQNETIEYNNRNPAGLLWANIMSRIHTGLQSKKFEKPNTVSSALICSKTGKRARTGCSDTYMEYFLWLTVPELCDNHSGEEVGVKSETNLQNNITNTVQEIVKEITEDIDVEENIKIQTNNITTNTQNTQKDNVNNIIKNESINNNKTNSNVNNFNNNSNEINNQNENTFNNTNTINNTNNDINVNSLNINQTQVNIN